MTLAALIAAATPFAVQADTLTLSTPMAGGTIHTDIRGRNFQCDNLNVVQQASNQRYHESLNNVTPAGAYFGRAHAILNKRERIKQKTLETQRLQHRKFAA